MRKVMRKILTASTKHIDPVKVYSEFRTLVY